MKRRSILTIVGFLAVYTGCLNVAEAMPKYRIMMTAANIGSPDPLFTEPCTWPVLRDNIDGYKYYGRQFMGPEQRRLDAKAFARFTTKAKFVVGVEFGHMFLPPKGSKQKPWQRWLTEAIAEIQPVFDAGGRVDTVHIDGAIRRLLGHGGGGGSPQRGLPYDQAIDQFVRFWVALEKNYPGIQLGYLVNFPNWDYTKQYHGLIGGFTDDTGKYFHDIISDFHTRLTKAGGKISFLEVDCPYMYYAAKKTHAGDAPVDNPGKIRELERWCDKRKIDLYMIVNEQCMAQSVKNPAPEKIARQTEKFIDNSLLYVQAIKDDGITPEVFLIQSWYGVPRVHVPETQPGTMTYVASKIAQKIHDCFGKPASQSQWQRDKHSLLTNFNNMYNPCVVETGGEYRYKMWFFGWAADHTNKNIPGCDAIFHARSKDLRSWEAYSNGDTWDATMDPTKWAPVLHASERWYEAWHVGDPSVVFKDGKYYMAYSATSKHFAKIAGYPATMVQCVMGAVSADGIHWRKTENPILHRPEDTANPKPAPERIGDFHRPSLHWDEGKWRLWFDYRQPGKGGCVGYAENSGDFMKHRGFKVQHDLRKPLIEMWPNPEVIRIGKMYHCFSDPSGYPIEPGQSGWMRRQLREAVSADGLSWKKLDYIEPDDDADACHVPQGLVTKIDNKEWLYLFYATQIGYKKNDGKYHYQYDRIRAMRREIDDTK